MLNIERQFKGVKASANDLIGEIQTVKQSAIEGVNMMQALADRYDEAIAKIKTLKESLKAKEADNAALVARIVDTYEKSHS